MGNKSLPPLTLELPELVGCDADRCEEGIIQGTFHQMICAQCDGSGLLDMQTRKPIPNECLIPAMRKTIKHLRSRLKAAEHRVAELSPEPRLGDPYPDDMPKRCNGIYRLD